MAQASSAKGGARRGEPTATMAGLSTLVSRSSAPVALDQVDRDLLTLLADDPRVSQRQLAKQVGMSAPAIGERIARLERLGVIRGYTVDIDWGAVGLPVLVYIPMTIAAGSDVKVLLDELRAIPELEELVVVTGDYDFIARFRLRDHSHLQEILLDRLYPIAGLRRFETLLSLGEIPVEIALQQVLATQRPE
jgi:Lrp/AsnC family leucine-responsive transcriptional regulator